MLILLFCFPLLAQESGDIEMADIMRSNGKIYVVVGVIVTIFAGILFYLFQTDLKVRKLEKQLEETEKGS